MWDAYGLRSMQGYRESRKDPDMARTEGTLIVPVASAVQRILDKTVMKRRSSRTKTVNPASVPRFRRQRHYYKEASIWHLVAETSHMKSLEDAVRLISNITNCQTIASATSQCTQDLTADKTKKDWVF